MCSAEAIRPPRVKTSVRTQEQGFPRVSTEEHLMLPPSYPLISSPEGLMILSKPCARKGDFEPTDSETARVFSTNLLNNRWLNLSNSKLSPKLSSRKGASANSSGSNLSGNRLVTSAKLAKSRKKVTKPVTPRIVTVDLYSRLKTRALLQRRE